MRRPPEAQRQRIRPYLSAALRKRLEAYRHAQGITASAVVEAALTEYLDRAGPLRVALRRLDALAGAVGRAHRDIGLLLDSFASFVQLWFAHTPELPEDAQDEVWTDTSRRYGAFVRFVSHTVRSDRYADRLAQELAADDQELAALRDGKSPDGAAP